MALICIRIFFNYYRVNHLFCMSFIFMSDAKVLSYPMSSSELLSEASSASRVSTAPSCKTSPSSAHLESGS